MVEEPSHVKQLSLNHVCKIGLRKIATLLDGSNVRLNWNIESDMNVNWIKFKNFLSLY